MTCFNQPNFLRIKFVSLQRNNQRGREPSSETQTNTNTTMSLRLRRSARAKTESKFNVGDIVEVSFGIFFSVSEFGRMDARHTAQHRKINWRESFFWFGTGAAWC